jgi:hypothetical protein
MAFEMGWFRYSTDHRKVFILHFPLRRDAYFGRTSRPAKCLCGSRDPACPAIALATAEENSMGNGWLNRKNFVIQHFLFDIFPPFLWWTGPLSHMALGKDPIKLRVDHEI